MKTTIYFIPGFGETGSEVRYKKLAHKLVAKGYIVNVITPDWYRTLSENAFKPKKNSILIGFSYGAVIAYLVAKKYGCKKLILCSLSPIHTFTWDEIYHDYLSHMNEEWSRINTADVMKINIGLKNLKTPHVTLAGDHEELRADLFVPFTGHYISPSYINAIVKMV